METTGSSKGGQEWRSQRHFLFVYFEENEVVHLQKRHGITHSSPSQAESFLSANTGVVVGPVGTPPAHGWAQERLVAFFVLFHAMARKVQQFWAIVSFGILKYEPGPPPED